MNRVAGDVAEEQGGLARAPCGTLAELQPARELDQLGSRLEDRRSHRTRHGQRSTASWSSVSPCWTRFWRQGGSSSTVNRENRSIRLRSAICASIRASG